MLMQQVSVFMENKAGRAAQVTKTLGEAGVNIRAMAIADTTRFGVMHAILDDTEKGIAALKKANMTISVTEVVAVLMDDTPGSLNKILETLGKADINIEYLYAFVTKKPGSAAVIIRVEKESDGAKRAEAALKEAGVPMLSMEYL